MIFDCKKLLFIGGQNRGNFCFSLMSYLSDDIDCRYLLNADFSEIF